MPFIPKSMRRTATLLASLALMACGGEKTDSAREIELAPTDSSVAMNDVAPAPNAAAAPTTPRSTARPAPARPNPTAPTTAAPSAGATAPATATSRTGTLSRGATITVASESRVCTNTHKVGDRFTALTSEALTATNNVSIPAGSEVTMEVVESARGENSQEKVKLAFKPVSITVRGATAPLEADVTQLASLTYARVQSTGTQAGKVAAGAAAGAIAGQVLGRDTKSTVAGAAVGAAAGGAVALATADYNGCLAANGSMTLTLTSPLTVR